MSWVRIDTETFIEKVFGIWRGQGLLLAGGDFRKGRFNAMTVGWGSMGVMWGRPFVQVVVRPTRYTYRFMEEYDSFTLSFFISDYAEALAIMGLLPASARATGSVRFRDRELMAIMGSRSGRHGDKIAAAGLTPIASAEAAAPSFAEAFRVIECRRIYRQDIDPQCFLDPALEAHYPKRDYHRAYFGQVLCIREQQQDE